MQDDTGIPALVFTDREWQVRPYGRYVRPIDMFRGYYQKKLTELYASADRVPLEFGVGYYYRVADCNMILAARDGNSVVVAAAAPAAATVPAQAAAAPTPAPRQSPSIVVAAAPTPAPAPIVVAANAPAGEKKTPRKKLIELEAEELRIRKDPALDKKQRMQKLREIWKQQLEVMGKRTA